MLSAIEVNATTASVVQADLRTIPRTEVVVDGNRVAVGDPQFDFLGRGGPLSRKRMLLAPGLDQGVTVLKRYYPIHPVGESCYFGLDFSAIIPFGAGIEQGTLAIFTNTATPTPADGDWVKGAVEVHGRQLRAILSGGLPGTDYRLTWTATDSAGNVWPRTTLCLVGDTS